MDKSLLHEGALDSMKYRRKMRDPAESERESLTFESLFNEHWALINRHLVRLVGDPAEAEDLALETFLRLYQRKVEQPDGFNLGGWLYRVATNLGLQSIRSFRRREGYEMAAGRNALEEISDNEPAKIQVAHEEQQRVRRILAGMNPKQSQLLVLRHSGMSYREIGAMMALSSTSIGPLLVRAEREFERRFRAQAQEEL